MNRYIIMLSFDFFFRYFFKGKSIMEKADLMIFASVFIISAFYIYFFDEEYKSVRKKKFDKEIDEAIKSLNYDNFTEERLVSEK